MSKIELLAKIELLNKYEAMIEEMKEEADKVRNSIKAEMEQREVEELIAGQYIVRWTSVLSNRFDSTAFKKVMPEIYKASSYRPKAFAYFSVALRICFKSVFT
jgi:predicted phage-related endonuclease